MQVTGKADNGVIYINAQDKITTNAANIENNAQNGETVLTAKDIELGTVTLSHKEKFGEISDKNHRIVEITNEVGTNIQADGDIKIIANSGSLKATALNVDSANGTATLYGEKSVDIKDGRQTLFLDEAYENKSKGFLSSKTTTARIQRNDDEAIHSNITGNQVAIQSKGDISLTGTNAVSDNGTVVYSENGDINIQAAQNFYNTQEEKTVKKSGLLGTGGIGFTIGQQKNKTENDNTALLHSGSMVGSLNGDTTIYAGKDYQQIGSTVLSANGKSVISADKVDILAAENKNVDKYKQTFEQKGVTVALSSAITDMAQAAYGVAKSAENVGKSKNNRVNAMAAANTAYGAYNVANSATSALQNTQNGLSQMANGQMSQGAGTAGVKVSISYGQQKNTQESNSVSTNAQSSQVLGEKVNITARKSDLTIVGSDISGSLNTDLSAKNNVNIKSFEEIYSNRSKNKSEGFNAGVAIEFGQGMSFGFTAGANYGKGYENADSTSHRNSHVGSSTGQTNITAGEVVNIKGGQVIGKGVDITAKDLNIESLQDTMSYNSRQENISGSITVGYGVSGSASYSKDKASANSAIVGEQSGVFAGDNGYNINLSGSLNSKGGAILSTAQREKNHLTAQDFLFENVENYSNVSASSMGLGGGFAMNGFGNKSDNLTAQNPKANDGEKMLTGWNSFEINNGQATGKQGHGKYAITKTIAQNLLNNGSASDNSHNVTQAIISDGVFNIGTDSGKANIERVAKGTVSNYEKLENVDVGQLKEDAKTTQEFKNNLSGTFFSITDNIYDTKLQKNRKYYELVRNENSSIARDEENPVLPKTVEIDGKSELAKDENGVVHIHINGILNGEYGKENGSFKKYAEQNGTDLEWNKDVTQYAMHEPQVEGWRPFGVEESVLPEVHEVFGAIYDKFLNNTTLGLSNGSKQIITQIEKYGKDGLQLDAHSNGSQVLNAAVHALAQNPDNYGKYPNLKITIIEGAANVLDMDKDLAFLQGRKDGEFHKSLQYESNASDCVSSCWYMGHNKPTYNRPAPGAGDSKLKNFANLSQATSVHNTQGVGTDEAIRLGLRGQNRPEAGTANRINYDGIRKSVYEVYGDLNIPQAPKIKE